MVPYGSLPQDRMPAPDKIVRYGSGMFGPAMFHYAAETDDPIAIARGNGFDMKLVRLEDEFPDDHPMMRMYFEEGELVKVFTAWLPKVPSPDWKRAGMHDTEDGPVAILLRKLPAGQ